MAREGKMKTKSVSPAQIEKYLQGVDFPCMKQELIDQAEYNNAPEEIIQHLERLPDREYKNAGEVTKSMKE